MKLIKPKIHKLPNKRDESAKEEEGYIRSEVTAYLDRFFKGEVHAVCLIVEEESDGDFDVFRVGEVSGRHTCGLLQDAIESVRREQGWEYFDDEE